MWTFQAVDVPIGYPAADTFQDPFLVSFLQNILENNFYKLLIFGILTNVKIVAFIFSPQPQHLGT